MRVVAVGSGDGVPILLERGDAEGRAPFAVKVGGFARTAGAIGQIPLQDTTVVIVTRGVRQIAVEFVMGEQPHNRWIPQNAALPLFPGSLLLCDLLLRVVRDQPAPKVRADAPRLLPAERMKLLRVNATCVPPCRCLRFV